MALVGCGLMGEGITKFIVGGGGGSMSSINLSTTVMVYLKTNKIWHWFTFLVTLRTNASQSELFMSQRD